MAAGGMAATAALGTSAGAAVAASAGAAGTAALGSVGGMGAAGAAAAGVLGGVTVAAAAPFVVGTAAALGTGVVVSKAFTGVRNGVRAQQQRRRPRAFKQFALALPVAELDENGAPITDAALSSSRTSRSLDRADHVLGGSGHSSLQ